MGWRAWLSVLCLVAVAACGDDGGNGGVRDGGAGTGAAGTGGQGGGAGQGGSAGQAGTSGEGGEPADAAIDADGIDATVTIDAGTDAGDAGAGDQPHCKRGVAYGYHSVADLQALRPGVSWWYNWSPRPDQGVRTQYADLGFEFTPMLWNGNFDRDGIIDELVDDAQYVLGFNEPNFYAQANMSPAQVAERWPDVEAIADARGLKIVGPAVNFCGPENQCHDTDPFDYLDDFFAACANCRVDYIAAHWYACDGPALSWYLGELKKYNKPIWLTEFSCGDGNDRSLAKQMQYMNEAIPILENDPDVFRYSWFAGRTDVIPNVSLLDEDGELTELGELYVSLPHHDPRCAR